MTITLHTVLEPEGKHFTEKGKSITFAYDLTHPLAEKVTGLLEGIAKLIAEQKDVTVSETASEPIKQGGFYA